MLFKKKAVEAPLNYWEEMSYMLVVTPGDASEYAKKAIDNISKMSIIKVKDKKFDVERGFVNLRIEYEKDTYDVGLYPGGISIPEFYLNNGLLFSEEDKKRLLSAKDSVTLFMKYNEKYDVSYHLQLKLVTALVPDLIGVLDESAEKMLPAKWVFNAASAKTCPCPASLFNVHAVQGKNDEVWLHTHGLCRCGIPELEILESDAKNYQNHYNLISTYATYLLDKNKKGEDIGESAFIGRLIDGNPVVVTSRRWTEGINEYKHLKLGNLKDRAGGHNTKTNIIFLYRTEEDEKNDVLSKVSIYDKLWGDNPLFFISDEETARMKSLAMERFDCVKEAFKDKDNHILIKVGIPLKQKGKFEHIWFELLEIKGKKFKGKLTQEPYDVPDMHTGDEAWYTVDDVTDWVIYTKKFSVIPDNSYLLDEKF